MSQENVEIVQRAWELGLDAAAERYLDPGIEFHEDPRWPGASSYKGRAAVLQCFRGYVEALALGDEGAVSVSVEQVLDASERGVVAIIRYSGQAPSGLPYEHRWGYVFQVEDGRIVYLRGYYEPAEALKAVRLSEQDAHADS
jgi:ketosteroid isomerase-like protein